MRWRFWKKKENPKLETEPQKPKKERWWKRWFRKRDTVAVPVSPTPSPLMEKTALKVNQSSPRQATFRTTSEVPLAEPTPLADSAAELGEEILTTGDETVAQVAGAVEGGVTELVNTLDPTKEEKEATTETVGNELFKGTVMEKLYERLDIQDDPEARKTVEVFVFNTIITPFGIAGWVVLMQWLWPAAVPAVLAIGIPFYILVTVIGIILVIVKIARGRGRRERGRER